MIKKKRVFTFIMLLLILVTVLPINAYNSVLDKPYEIMDTSIPDKAMTATITVVVYNTSNIPLVGITVEFIDNSGNVYTGITTSGGVSLTTTSGKTYGINVYTANYERQYYPSAVSYSTNTYNFWLRPYSVFPTYSIPTSYLYLSSRFGWRYLSSLQKHKGLDMAAYGGTTIYSCASGTVVDKDYNQYRGYYVVVSHGYYYSIYQHMNAASPCNVNDSVTTSSIMGYVGNTGDVTGYHLHFEIADSSYLTGYGFDPESFLN